LSYETRRQTKQFLINLPNGERARLPRLLELPQWPSRLRAEAKFTGRKCGERITTNFYEKERIFSMKKKEKAAGGGAMDEADEDGDYSRQGNFKYLKIAGQCLIACYCFAGG
jgi:hypothetical protein